MYLPTHFEEKRTDVLMDMIRRYPLGCMIVQSNGEMDLLSLMLRIISYWRISLN